jgi:predicted GIY-YIG superfamily endonuclease
MRYSVYTLTDPEDGQVFYVGCTHNIDQRYRYHCNASDPTSSAYHWLIHLKERGLRPLLSTVIEADDLETAMMHEAHWINFYLDEGEPLMNCLNPPGKPRIRSAHA